MANSNEKAKSEKLAVQPEKELTSWELYQQERLPSVLSWCTAAAFFAILVSMYLGRHSNCEGAMGTFYRGREPLVKGGPGLRSGEFIATCTSRMNTTCGTALYFVMGNDGDLGLYTGYTPDSPGSLLWNATVPSYPFNSTEYVAKYEKSGALTISKKRKNCEENKQEKHS
mmetsp:Transcript_28058/g.36434  ORF Transcript_28058/g.36434 Transcript_28058/m.36434 type:complete len:170 (+) Transcript_28058:82-591(+)